MKHKEFFTDMLPDAKLSLGMKGNSPALTNRNPYPGLGLKSAMEYMVDETMSHSFGLAVGSVGQQKILPAMPYSPIEAFRAMETCRVLNAYRLVYVTDGAGSFYAGQSERSMKVQGGYLLWVTPRQQYSYTPDSHTGWTEYHICFNGEMVENLIRHTFLDGKSGAFNLGFNDELAGLFMRALDVARQKSANYQSYLSGIVMHMLGLILSQLKEQMDYSCEHDQKMEQAKIIMNEKIAADLDFSVLAASLGLSYSWFRKLFKDYTGNTPAKYFLELKVNKMKQLLLTTKLPVKEILYRLGFNSADYFQSVFKRNTGYTPAEYRRVMLEKRNAG